MIFSRSKKLAKVPTGRKFADFRFQANHPVTLDVNNEDYGSAVYDWTEAEIIIFAPRGKRTGEVLSLVPDDTVTILIPQQGSAFVGKARVTNVQGGGQQVLVTLAMPEELHEKQRRQFFRVSIQLPLRYSPVSGKGLKPEDFRSTSTVDLSGGGAKFSADKFHRRGDQVYIRFNIMRKGEVRGIVAMGKVVRIEESLGRGTIIAVQFTDIADREQEELIQYLNAQIMAS